MAKFIRHDFGAIHEALNKMIIAETKTALMELPDKEFETESATPLCRVVVSRDSNYHPCDLRVRRVWLNDDNELCFSEYTAEEDEDDVYTWTEDDDMLDITDFGYLIDQIAQKVEEDKTVYIVNKRIAACEIAPELDLGTAIHRTN